MTQPNQSGISDNGAGALAYVTFIPAIIFLLVEPYNRSSYVKFHSWQSIFFFIAWVCVNVVLRVLLGVVPFFGLMGLALWPLVGLLFFILWIILLMNAVNGKRFKLPIIGDLAEKQANG